MKKTELTNQSLCWAVTEMSLGLFDANLGGHIFKKRIGLANKGKRSGARTLIASNLGSKWFFVYGFEKSERANIASNELEALQELAMDLINKTHSELDEAIAHGKLEEICHAQKNES